MLNDTLCRHGISLVIRRCLTHAKVEHDLNDYHAGVCGGHLSCMATAQFFLRAGYYWPTLFKDYITAVQQCHLCQIFTKKMCEPPTPLHPIISIGPFAKWGIDFITYNPTSFDGKKFIIVTMDYFMKWATTVPTFRDDGGTCCHKTCH